MTRWRHEQYYHAHEQWYELKAMIRLIVKNMSPLYYIGDGFLTAMDDGETEWISDFSISFGEVAAVPMKTLFGE